MNVLQVNFRPDAAPLILKRIPLFPHHIEQRQPSLKYPFFPLPQGLNHTNFLFAGTRPLTTWRLHDGLPPFLVTNSKADGFPYTRIFFFGTDL